MKLMIQIPCLNEELTLAETIVELDLQIPGIHDVEILVIDDCSNDRTSDVAKECGAHHVVRFRERRGLARAFAFGLEYCIAHGADIIVNTDGDNQYAGLDIPALVTPILNGQADMVVGDRGVKSLRHFSAGKKFFQQLGTLMVSFISKSKFPDVTSGFRALSREAATSINISSDFTYTIETLIQAAQKNLTVKYVPVTARPPRRESRLSSGSSEYIRKSISSILRLTALYRPLAIFLFIGGLLFIAGFFIGCRFLYYYFSDQGASGHVQSLILSTLLMILGFQIMVIGLVADILAANRKLLEDINKKLRKNA